MNLIGRESNKTNCKITHRKPVEGPIGGTIAGFQGLGVK